MSTAVFRKSIAKVLAIMLTAALIISVAAPASFAASKSSGGYKYISRNPVKVGNYYYKYAGSGKIAKSKYKNKGYKTILKKCNNGACTNGKYIYYILNKGYRKSDDSTIQDIMRCSVSGKSAKKIKRLTGNYLGDYSIKASYKNLILLNLPQSEGCCIYVFNVNKNKLSRISGGGRVISTSGKYVFAADSAWANNYSKYSVRTITSTGKLKTIKKFKNLKSFSLLDGNYSGKYLYYALVSVEYTDDSFNEANSTIRIYRCNKNGSKSKKIGTIKVDKGITAVDDINSKTCILENFNYSTEKLTCYKYSYKTGSMKEISSAPYK